MAHILVMDDDEQFHAMMVQMLNQDGHQVSIAVDGEEGFQLTGTLGRDLIITDILMPKKDGMDLILELNRADKKIPVIAVSGGRRCITAEFNLDSASLPGVKATRAKPFSRADWRQALASALS